MRRAVRNILRLLAGGMVISGGLEFGLEFMRHRLRGSEIRLWSCIVGAILVGLGVVLFWGSGRLAERLTDDFED